MIQPRTSKASLASATARAATGVLLLCTGQRGDLLRNCIGSLRNTNPELRFHLLTDRPYDVPFQWVKSWTGKASRRIKTQLHKYTPFDVTLFADDDTVFAKPVALLELLGEADMAFASDVLPTLEQASCMVKWPHHVSTREVEETIACCGKDHPFFNTGVMLWRNDSPTVHGFFDRWWQEWQKYRQCDQFAFVRALKDASVKVKVLPQSYNSGVYDHTCVKNAHIHHLLGKQNVAKRFGLWNPLPEGPFETAFANARDFGLMTENQYQYIARTIHTARPCSVLVFGAGYDFQLWYRCADGNVGCVEDNPDYFPPTPFEPVSYQYESKVGEWRDVPAPPQAIVKPWDFVVVDGPNGQSRSSPGRQFPVAWAARLARKAVFVHDYDRSWEMKVCGKYLGPPSEIVEARGRNDRRLADFNCSRGASL